MSKNKPPKRLFKSPDRVSLYEHDRSANGLIKQVSRDHLDVLQNIEFTLVEAHRNDPRVDDSDARSALRSCLRGTKPEEPRVALLVLELQSVREVRADVPDDVWHAALRVVDDSVGTHSSFRPRETSYLSFAAQFVP